MKSMINMKNQILQFMAVSTVAALFGLGAPALALESRFVGEGTPQVGGEWRVQVLLKSPIEKVNTFGGEISFPSEIVVPKRVEDARSVVSLWVENPTVHNSSISFAGITPGGYQGENGELLTIVFTIKKSGSGVVGLAKQTAYLNDGKGTPTAWNARELQFTVGSGVGTAKEINDALPPEPFTLALGRNQSIYDNKWFVAFATKDKQSGVAAYEVQETKGDRPKQGAWQSVTSPYVLNDQSLQTSVFVRAIDYANNVTVASLVLPKGAGAISYQKIVIWGILILSLLLGLFVWVRRRRQRTM